MSEQRLDTPIYINGVNGSTGEALLPLLSTDTAENKVLTWRDLVNQITGRDDDLYKVSRYRSLKGDKTFGVKAGIDANNLEQAGWGIVYAPGISEEIKEALSPLVNWRQGQANKVKELFKIYQFKAEHADPQRGYRVFMRENNTAARDDADPEEMPYYLLLVGSPEEIPYTFQYALDVNRAVGRIFFDTAVEYANYAQSVVAAEKENLQLPRQATFFGVTNENDPATRLSTEHLIKPLFDHFQENFSDKWDINSFIGEQAKQAQLRTILGGEKQQTPAFLLTGSHGIGFDSGDSRQQAHQGALLCSDWARQPGYIPEEMYLAGEHIDNSAQLHGQIAFFFACYGAGTPMQDDFMGKTEGTAKQIAPGSFIAKLPQRMLSHPRGGALAVIGHVDRAWTYSFLEDSNVIQKGHLAFESTLTELLQGGRIGHTFDYFNRKHASSSVGLVNLLDEQRRGKEVDDYELIDTWIMNHDARDYIILGDPAVRLCVDYDEGQINESALSLKEIDLRFYQAGNLQQSPDSENGNQTSPPSQAEDPDETGQPFILPSEAIEPSKPPKSPNDIKEMVPGVRYDWIEKFNGKEKFVANWAIQGSRGKKLVTIEANPSTRKLLNNINLRTGKPYDTSDLPGADVSFSITSAESMGILDGDLGASLQDALQKFSGQVSRALRDLGTLEVLTYLSDDDLKNVYDAENKTFREAARLKAVTLLSLDGDVQSMVPAKKVETEIEGETKVTVEIDSALLDIHKEMVALAQENQARFFKNIIEVAASLVKMGN